MEEKPAEELALDAAMLAGAKRCVGCRKTGTAVLLPATAFVGEEKELCRRQREAFSRVALDIYQTELLKRAKSFLDFWDFNAGGTDDFPIIITADSAEGLNMLEKQLSDLRCTVGLLSEV